MIVVGLMSLETAGADRVGVDFLGVDGWMIEYGVRSCVWVCMGACSATRLFASARLLLVTTVLSPEVAAGNSTYDRI